MQVKFVSALSVLAAAVALAACSKGEDDRTAGQKLDSAVAQTEQKMDQMADKAKSQSQETTSDVKQMADSATDKVKDAAQTAGDAVKDAAITTAVNAELARAPKLSALKIDVDTSNGHVALKGTAPDAESRDHATTLAKSVSGVVSVDNQLVVSPHS